MAAIVLSECCGLRPLPAAIRFRLRPRLLAVSHQSFVSAASRPVLVSQHGGASRVLRDWAVRIRAPARPVVVEPHEEEVIMNPQEVVRNPPEEFDPGMPPSFGLAEIRASIPKHCWVKDPWRSMSYVVRDVAIVFGLATTAAYFNSWIVWPLYWAAQGTLFWALFVLGHDWYGDSTSAPFFSSVDQWYRLVSDENDRILSSGHGSFSSNLKLNSVVGHILHSSILVPYHGWRISHRTHHQNHGHVENDESWHPLPEKIYKSLDFTTWKLRFTMPFPMLAFPIYLFCRSPGKAGSHFNPKSDLFVPNERKDVITSTACLIAMAAVLAGLTWLMGPLNMFKLYAVPYMVFVMWLDTVTYLHHHGHEDKLPWYRGKEWSYLRGGLTTLDRDYGWINNIHHDIGTHVIHHLFPQIPHYHLIEATAAAKPVLGKYYREPETSGPLPFHLLGVLSKSLKLDHYVSDFGDIVYYQKDSVVSSGKNGYPEEGL